MRAWARSIASLCAVAALGGCDVLRHQTPGSLEVRGARIVVAADGAQLDLALDCQLNGPMSDALEHGIPITLRIDLSAESAREDINERRDIELRYFPLTRRYQLRDSGDGNERSFSAYGALVDALGALRVPLPEPFGELSPGTRVRVRVGLDHSALPGPLRLPAILEPAWRLVAPEHAWTVAAG